MSEKFNPKILILSIAFRPNIGGLETHLDDLTVEIKKKCPVLVVTLPPISTKVSAKTFEKDGNLLIWRVPWFGKNLFYKFLKWPILEFIYLMPPLFFGLLVALIKYPSIQVIHAQGFSSGLPGVFLGRIFSKRILISTAYIFHFKKNFVGKIAKWVFSSADRVLCVSNPSTEEMKKLGIPENKLGKCAYWINLDIFKPKMKNVAKKEVGWEDCFSVLFVGRLVEEKGIRQLLQAVLKLPKQINVYIIGDGPLKEEVEKASDHNTNLYFLGKIDNSLTPIYYSAADTVVVPSYEETLGRVNMEALACKTPVIVSKGGGVKEVVDESVGLLIDVNPNDIAKAIIKLYRNKNLYNQLQKNARLKMKREYSNKNIKKFIKEYGIK